MRAFQRKVAMDTYAGRPTVPWSNPRIAAQRAEAFLPLTYPPFSPRKESDLNGTERVDLFVAISVRLPLLSTRSWPTVQAQVLIFCPGVIYGIGSERGGRRG